MTTKYDHLRGDIIEVIKKYNPEVIDDKVLNWELDDLIETIEQFEKDNLESVTSNDEKYTHINNSQNTR